MDQCCYSILSCYKVVMHNNVVAYFLFLSVKINIRSTKLLFSYMFERRSSETDLSVSLCLDSHCMCHLVARQ